MASFEDNLARMKALYTYGKELNENKTPLNYTIEHTAVAADGNTYGIIRECRKYYIKKARKGQENIAESYDYLGGFCNRKQYEYDSYGNALKNFELKMGSLNEAYEGTVETSTLDPFRKEEFIVEGTEAFRNEIARQRQIMHNVAVLMNESTEIGADRKKDGTVMYDGENPEAETGKKGCEGNEKACADPEYKGSDTKGMDKKAEPFSCNAPSCKDQLKEGSECSEETCAECGNVKSECTCGKQGECNENAAEPSQIGWDMDGDRQVSENSELECGIPEAEDKEDPSDSKEDDADEFDIDDIDWDDIDLGDLEFADDADNYEPGDELSDDAEDISDDEPLEEPENGHEDDGDGEGDDEDEEFDIDLNLDDEDEDEEDEPVPSEEELDAELDSEDEDEDDDEEEEVPAHDAGDHEAEDDGEDFHKDMDDIINEVVNDIVAEEKLNVFGKHPGYRKKPMELPSTGEDKNQWGEDINDDSVHNEEPFGEKIGDGNPFNKMVSDITRTVIGKLNESLLSGGKKKVK